MNGDIDMSIGANHVVSQLTKTSKAMDGQRLARVIAKKGKDGSYESANLTESKCVSIPRFASLSAEQLQIMMPHVVGILENAQDALIRDRIIESGASSINDAEISFAKCVEYLEESAKGGRITTEYMQKWFDEVYSESALEFICVAVCKFDPEKLSVEQEQAIVKRGNVLRDMFAGFASPKYSPDIPKCKAMLKFGEFLGEDNWDERMSGLIEKVGKIKKQKEEELSMDALGFGD